MGAKKKSHKIYRGIISDLGPSEIYPVHLKALEIELEISLKRGKRNWISKRIEDLRSYLRDPPPSGGIKRGSLQNDRKVGKSPSAIKSMRDFKERKRGQRNA